LAGVPRPNRGENEKTGRHPPRKTLGRNSREGAIFLRKKGGEPQGCNGIKKGEKGVKVLGSAPTKSKKRGAVVTDKKKKKNQHHQNKHYLKERIFQGKNRQRTLIRGMGKGEIGATRKGQANGEKKKYKSRAERRGLEMRGGGITNIYDSKKKRKLMFGTEGVL